MNGANQVEINVGLCKGLLTKIAKKTCRLNKTQIDKGLLQAGFAEPKKSAVAGMLYNAWNHCLGKSRNMTSGLHLSQAEKQVVLALRAWKDGPGAPEAKVPKVKKDEQKEKIITKKEELPQPMMSHPEPVDEGFKIISHDLEAETVLIRHGQSFHDLPIHQGPEGWAIFEYEKKQHTMYDLPSLAINGKHGPLVMQEASTSMGSTDAWNPEVGEAQVDDSEDLIAEQLQELSQMWYPTPPAKHDDGAIGVIDLLTKMKEEQNTSPVHVVQQPLGASHPILNLAPLVPAQSLQPAPPTPNPAVAVDPLHSRWPVWPKQLLPRWQ